MNAPDSAATTNTQETVRTFREHGTGSPEAGLLPFQDDLSAFVMLRNQQPDKEQSRRGLLGNQTRSSDLPYSGDTVGLYSKRREAAFYEGFSLMG